MAGNKGAVAIRMEYANTSICLVTAHLAAGFANYEERNQDYKTISHGLRFQRNRTIEDHDTIIWLGDFNYRIGMSNERTRALVKTGDLDTLYANDQLNLQMVHGRTFPFYNEGRITFLPTYKYDLGTDEYDSSDKARIPAWCDRVLTKGHNLRQINYETAPLKFSDHRPVWANFQCTITVIDEKHKDEISEQLYRQRRSVVGDSTANTHAEDTDDEDLLGYESIEPGLPPASSDRRKWWLDNGQPARSQIKGPPGPEYTHNAARPANPFSQSSEPDWVKVDRPTPPPSRTMSMRERSAAREASEGLARRPTQAARKLPPAWEGPNSAGTHNASNTPLAQPALQPARRAMAPPPKPATSSSSPASAHPAPHLKQTLRKAAPPLVPRKPALLRSESGAPGQKQTQDHERYRDEPSPPPPAAQPPPKRTGTGISHMQVGTPSSVAANSVPYPPPPRRSATASQQQQQSSGSGGGVNRSGSVASTRSTASIGHGYASGPPPTANRAAVHRVPVGAKAGGGGQQESGDEAPPLPARVGQVGREVSGTGARSASPAASLGSLMDDDEESDRAVKGWAALRPT